MNPRASHLLRLGWLGFSLLGLIVGSSACRPARPAVAPPQISFTVLATADVHGWLHPPVTNGRDRSIGGLGLLAAMWRDVEGVRIPAGPPSSSLEYLLLDSGDMWTGPPESTLAEGMPTIEAYNAMGFHAAALGNHEFDFKMGALRRNAAMLRAPLLAANVTTGPESPPIDFCKPSVRYRVKGIEVGVIGLATIDTPRTTFPSHVEGLRFEAYLPAVRAQARALVADGAEVLIVLAHVPLADLRPVAEATADLPIRLFIGGHDHQRQLEVIERDPATEADDVVMINPGPYAQHYGAVALTFAGGELIAHAARIVPVVGPPVDPPREPTVAAIVDRASEAVRPLLEQVVGRLDTRAEPGTLDFSPLGHLVADAWLERFSHAEVAITNLGGLRQPLEAGSVRMRDIMGTLPFSNDLVLVRLTPAQLRESLQGSTMLVGGIRYYYHLEAGRRVITRLQTSQGQPLEENRRYTVITTDFLYAGGDGMPFRRMDPEPTRLGVSWREPLVEYFRRRPDRGVVPPSDPRALPD